MVKISYMGSRAVEEKNNIVDNVLRIGEEAKTRT